MTTTVTSAIIPAASPDRRMRPATDAMPSELLPVGGRPAIDWVLEEAALSGIRRVVVVGSREKPALSSYVFKRVMTADEDSWAASTLSVEVVCQQGPFGLADAIRVGAEVCVGEAAAVMLPGELMFGAPGVLRSMLEESGRVGCSTVGIFGVPRGATGSYPCVEVEATGGVLHVRGCEDNPAQGTRSPFALGGRYVLQRDVLSVLGGEAPRFTGRAQLIFALDLAARAGRLEAVEVSREDGRADLGNWRGWLDANRRAFCLADAAPSMRTREGTHTSDLVSSTVEGLE